MHMYHPRHPPWANPRNTSTPVAHLDFFPTFFVSQHLSLDTGQCFDFPTILSLDTRCSHRSAGERPDSGTCDELRSRVANPSSSYRTSPTSRPIQRDAPAYTHSGMPCAHCDCDKTPILVGMPPYIEVIAFNFVIRRAHASHDTCWSRPSHQNRRCHLARVSLNLSLVIVLLILSTLFHPRYHAVTGRPLNVSPF